MPMRYLNSYDLFYSEIEVHIIKNQKNGSIKILNRAYWLKNCF